MKLKIILILIITVLISCSTVDKTKKMNIHIYPLLDNTNIYQTIEEDSLSFNFWLLMELNDSTLQFKRSKDKYRYLHFFDGQIGGSTSEQRFTAKYNIDSNRINIYKVRTVDRIRATDLVTKEYFKMLIDAKKFNMISDTLFLFDSTDKIISKFLKY